MNQHECINWVMIIIPFLKKMNVSEFVFVIVLLLILLLELTTWC